MMSLMWVCRAMQMSSPWRVSNWKMCSTPATLILKKTAALLLPNCMMSLSSAEWMYSLGTGRKKWTPRLLMPRMALAGSRPMGSSMRRTVKKMELPAASDSKISIYQDHGYYSIAIKRVIVAQDGKTRSNFEDTIMLAIVVKTVTYDFLVFAYGVSRQVLSLGIVIQSLAIWASKRPQGEAHAKPPEMASKSHVMAIDGRKAFAFSTYSNDASHMQLAVNMERTVAYI